MNTLDQLIHGFDGFLRTVARVKPEAQNRSPADGALEEPLTADETKLSGNLMRINHTGEICAQGLYNGQAVFASNHATYQALIKSAEEELHYLWCRDRLNDLGTGPSILILYGTQHLSVSGQGRRLFQITYHWDLSMQQKTTLSVTCESICNDYL